ncbi:hypothetical protein HNP92_001233 [Methanococcus maripaludis]|uniref:FRG domain-containing protein n=1 Tax=Methanococcus maripaludis TaxID=39152 RepID=A0A7J9SAA1_METMI|nr:FRG domain-containing protein [Methanococcus maripaludis]MBB6401928.1 hypothetical protein [Methanococcus maripaludis]
MTSFLIEDRDEVFFKKSSLKKLELPIYSISNLMDYLKELDELMSLTKFFSEKYRNLRILEYRHSKGNVSKEEILPHTKEVYKLDRILEMKYDLIALDLELKEKFNNILNFETEFVEYTKNISEIQELQSKKISLQKKYAEEIKELCDFEVSISEFLYRGQKNKEWKLEPAIFRKNKSGKLTYENKEKELYMSLKEHNHPEFEKQKTMFDKLALMQHYSIPTRLLDWSKNPLVALYFATEPDLENDTDGVVFVHSPNSIYYSSEEIVDLLCNMFLKWNKEEISLKELESTSFNGDTVSDILGDSIEDTFITLNIFSGVIFIRPIMTNDRLRIQQGCFSMHGCLREQRKIDEHFFENFFKLNEPSDTVLENYLENTVKFIIPSECKTKIRKELEMIGIHNGTMFPELENYGQFLKEKHKSN